jgi:iron complex transport system permease protein
LVNKKGDRGRIKPRSPENTHADFEKSRRAMRPETRRVFILGVTFCVLVFLVMILPLYMFEHSLMQFTLAVFLDVTANNLDGLTTVLTGGGGWFEFRFMAVVVCAVSGAALGLTGSTYQGAFNNPLAAPKTLGVMAGGALGALIYVLFLQGIGPEPPGGGTSVEAWQLAAWEASLNPLEWFWVNYGQSLCSIAGCLAVVAVVVGLTSLIGRGRMSNIIVIIFGQVFAGSVTALIAFARYYFTTGGGIDMVDQLREIENYTMVRTFYFYDLLIVVVPIVLCMVVVLLLRNRLTLLSFGDDEAASMGVNVNRTRYVMIIICTVMTGFAISFAGHVAFLGFISAHLARRIVGPDFRYLLPASVFVGGGLLTVIQYLAQSGLPWTSPYAAGVICSILGPLLFLAVVLKQRGEGGSGGWR